MKTIHVALVRGDGSGPEMIAQAIRCNDAVDEVDQIRFNYIPAPMGWEIYKTLGDTRPESSLQTCLATNLVFFGGVGDHQYDTTIGKEKPEMMPEPRCLLRLRSDMKLLLNFRPVILPKELDHLSPLKNHLIPDEGLRIVFVRYLLEDGYYGNSDFHIDEKTALRGPNIWKVYFWGAQQTMRSLGIKMKKDVTGDEKIITDLSYFTRQNIELFFRSVFEYARSQGLPVLSIDKANVLPRYEFWRKNVTRIATEFPDVPFKGHQYVDSVNEALFDPRKLNNCVVMLGNEHGDIISDGGAKLAGSLGMMHSSAINPINGAAMFESGAGTAPTLAGKDLANPIGRILAGALMRRHVGGHAGASIIEEAVRLTLKNGWRTADIAEPGCTKVVGCAGMGDLILAQIQMLTQDKKAGLVTH